MNKLNWKELSTTQLLDELENTFSLLIRYSKGEISSQLEISYDNVYFNWKSIRIELERRLLVEEIDKDM